MRRVRSGVRVGPRECTGGRGHPSAPDAPAPGASLPPSSESCVRPPAPVRPQAAPPPHVPLPPASTPHAPVGLCLPPCLGGAYLSGVPRRPHVAPNSPGFPGRGARSCRRCRSGRGWPRRRPDAARTQDPRQRRPPPTRARPPGAAYRPRYRRWRGAREGPQPEAPEGFVSGLEPQTAGLGESRDAGSSPRYGDSGPGGGARAPASRPRPAGSCPARPPSLRDEAAHEGSPPAGSLSVTSAPGRGGPNNHNVVVELYQVCQCMHCNLRQGVFR